MQSDAVRQPVNQKRTCEQAGKQAVGLANKIRNSNQKEKQCTGKKVKQQNSQRKFEW
jgi:hypothetical protein